MLYPEDSTDCTRLVAMCAWVATTDRGAVSSQAEKDARLEKFRTEFEDHFVKAPMLFYYLFTEVFLMVDSRAKNFFLPPMAASTGSRCPTTLTPS